MQKINHKFRVWNGKEFCNGGDGYSLHELTAGYPAAHEYGHIDDLVYQQWTGLVDKIGDEIYEGDYLGIPVSWNIPLNKGINLYISDSEELKEEYSRRYGKYSIYKVELATGTIDFNGGEYAALLSGFCVSKVYDPIHTFYKHEYPDYDSDLDDEHKGIGQKFEFTNYGTNGDIESEECVILGNIFNRNIIYDR